MKLSYGELGIDDRHDSDDGAGRYHRQELITWWDQARVRSARVLVIGAGALGNEILKILSLTGVGEVLVYDMDIIEQSNLSRGSLPRLWIDQLQGMCSGRTRGYGAESAGARQPHSANRAHRGHRRHRDSDLDRDLCLCCSRKSRARGCGDAASRLGLQQLWHARYQGRAVSPKTHPMPELHDSLSDLRARVVHDVRPVPLPGVRLNCRNSRHHCVFPKSRCSQELTLSSWGRVSARMTTGASEQTTQRANVLVSRC